MDDQLAITVGQVAAATDPASFQRGEAYARTGMIYAVRRQGRTLKAMSTGQSGGPYRVSATIDAGAISAYDCTCPRGGCCKHIVALLLTWIEHPDEFVEVEETASALARRSQAELIALIEEMLKRQPELETLLELPLPAGAAPSRPVDAEAYRHRAAAAFDGVGPGDWYAGAGIATELEALKANGDAFLSQGDAVSAQAIYQAVLDEGMRHYEGIDDEGGELAVVFQECVAGLGKCLAARQENSVARRGLLRALFDAYRADTEMGGLGLADEAPDLMLAHADAEDRQALEGWLRAAMPQPSGNEFSDRWHHEAYAHFLLALRASDADDETYLAEAQALGLYADAAAKLGELGRFDEAIALARQHLAGYELNHFLAALPEGEAQRAALPLVRERLAASYDPALTAWLATYAASQGDLTAALDLRLTDFEQHPSHQHYDQVRELARQLDRWPALQPRLLRRLEAAQQFRDLVDIALAAGDHDRALAILPRLSGAYGGWYGGSYQLRVAQAIEESRPETAQEIYQSMAEGLIEARGRGNYRAAAEHLTQARALAQRLGQQEAFAHYLQNLRESNHRLRALREELDAAGL